MSFIKPVKLYTKFKFNTGVNYIRYRLDDQSSFNPYKTITIDPHEIKYLHSGVPIEKEGLGQVRGGAWDSMDLQH